jgi:hippurate hydrolase
MSTLEAIAPFHEELTAIRRELHANPELGLDTPRTAALVAERLASWGIEVATGVGGHGVVGTIKGSGGDGPIVGLRADMDALPILEAADVPWKSQVAGRMHACGHDGHTTMLLGTAKYLAETRRFRGAARLIFQPGEEGAGGALAMLDDGLFERFPCDAVYGLHNRPNIELGRFCIGAGPFMAGGAFFDITVTGRGAHGGRPETSIDPVVVAAHLVSALQGIVARNMPPFEPAVLSVTMIHGGDAYNVIPDAVTLSGTARGLRPTTLPKIEALARRAAEGVAASFGATAKIDWRVLFAPLINDPAHATVMADAAADLAGEGKVEREGSPTMGSEDFAFMLEKVPGAYIQMGIGPTAELHNPSYAFNDEAIPHGAAFFARLVERVAPL